MSRFKQGFYTVRNPEKYIGDVNKVVYRSSWELHFNKFLDGNPYIVRWGSECIVVPYIKPTDGKVHRYFPDYYIERVNADGEMFRELIEIKPEAQTKLRKRSSIYEQLTFAVNESKWRAAQAMCIKQGITFRVLTERQLFPQGK